MPLKLQRQGVPGRRIVRPQPAVEPPPSLSHLLAASSPPARAPLDEPAPSQPSLARVERALLYVLGALIALVLVLSIVRPERWRAAFDQVRGVR